MAEVSAASGVPAETLRKIETGRIATPAFFTVAALAAALGLSLEDVARQCSLPADIRPAEIRPAEIRPAEIRPAEIRPAEIRPGKIRPGEIPSGEVLPAARRARAG
jgi:hypothetical protein